MVVINIAKDFSPTPGGRSKIDGDNSGEEFRERFLDKYVVEELSKEVTIELDGTYGYPTSFLEEAFGGLARKYGKNKVKGRFKFVSKEEPMLVTEIDSYIEKSDESA